MGDETTRSSAPLASGTAMLGRRDEPERDVTAAPAAEAPAISRYAITFGEVAILHVGGQELGEGKMRDEGFTVAELQVARDRINATGGSAQLVMLSDALPAGELRDAHEAAVLHVRGGVGTMLADAGAANRMLGEQKEVAYDTKFWHARQRKTMNKRARHNVLFGVEAQEASEDYQRCTVAPFSSVPTLEALRQALPMWLGPKATLPYAEGNHYFEARSGIGFHGDAERKIVICASLGTTSTLRYQWRCPGSSEPFGPRIDLEVRHGDVYVMSEKATGFDWMRRSQYRVVHAAGHAKYIGAN